MVRVYVEGGGDAASLKIECRRAFSALLKKAGFENKMPSVIPSGGRDAAFDAFKTVHAQSLAGMFVVLLVDSETIPASEQVWAHLNSQAGWAKPARATDDQAQLMVVCMETWLISDPGAFTAYFGKDFKKTKLPTTDLEKRAKPAVYNAIAAATATAKPKGKYGKAKHSFELLSKIDPAKLRKRCAWADHFFRALEANC